MGGGVTGSSDGHGPYPWPPPAPEPPQRYPATTRESTFTSRRGPDDGEVHFGVDAGTATLVLDRSPGNTLTGGFADALVEALDAASRDERVRAVVVTGAGSAFSIGADLTQGPDALRRLVEEDGGDRSGYREPAGRVTAAMARLDVPVVAALRGDAVGGGATIALGADLRFGATGMRIGFPFTRLGVSPEGASTYLLPRLVGAGRAADWLLSGRLVTADEAVQTGFLNAVVPADYVVPYAHEWTATIVGKTSPSAVAATRALLRAAPPDPDAASDAESRTIRRLIGEPDCAEGVAAFLERRRPDFAPREPG
jgi:enoyl-CoA hydratase/carnithine racemase